LTPSSPTGSVQSSSSVLSGEPSVKRTPSLTSSSVGWVATPEWVCIFDSDVNYAGLTLFLHKIFIGYVRYGVVIIAFLDVMPV
jgi:hypothetical protein